MFLGDEFYSALPKLARSATVLLDLFVHEGSCYESRTDLPVVFYQMSMEPVVESSG